MHDNMDIDFTWDKMTPKLHQSIIHTMKDSFQFLTCMPVQKATIPLFVKNYDVAVQAWTGSGKTLAFLIPIAQKMKAIKQKLQPNDVFALIVCPTRGLAQQILKVAQTLFQKISQTFKVIMFIGGQNKSIDIENLKNTGSNLVIVTPGKFKEILEYQEEIKANETLLNFQKFEMLILDEADRLLDQEFQDDLK